MSRCPRTMAGMAHNAGAGHAVSRGRATMTMSRVGVRGCAYCGHCSSGV